MVCAQIKSLNNNIDDNNVMISAVSTYLCDFVKYYEEKEKEIETQQNALKALAKQIIDKQ